MKGCVCETEACDSEGERRRAFQRVVVLVMPDERSPTIAPSVPVFGE